MNTRILTICALMALALPVQAQQSDTAAAVESADPVATVEAVESQSVEAEEAPDNAFAEPKGGKMMHGMAGKCGVGKCGGMGKCGAMADPKPMKHMGMGMGKMSGSGMGGKACKHRGEGKGGHKGGKCQHAGMQSGGGMHAGKHCQKNGGMHGQQKHGGMHAQQHGQGHGAMHGGQQGQKHGKDHTSHKHYKKLMARIDVLEAKLAKIELLLERMAQR